MRKRTRIDGSLSTKAILEVVFEMCVIDFGLSEMGEESQFLAKGIA